MGGTLEISFPMQQYERFHVYCEPGIFGSCGGKVDFAGRTSWGFLFLAVFRLYWFVALKLNIKVKWGFYVHGEEIISMRRFHRFCYIHVRGQHPKTKQEHLRGDEIFLTDLDI